MANVTYTPQSSEDATNFTTSVLSSIQDDPDSPDGNWWTAAINLATSCRVGFGTAPVTLTVGADLQEFKAWVRKNNSRDADTQIELWENGSLVRAGTATTITSATGELITFTWNGNEITDPDQVECRINSSASGGGGATSRSSIEIGAIEWNADIATADIATFKGMGLGDLNAINGVTKANVKTWNTQIITV